LQDRQEMTTVAVVLVIVEAEIVADVMTENQENRENQEKKNKFLKFK
jgi:hypothetical protein